MNHRKTENRGQKWPRFFYWFTRRLHRRLSRKALNPLIIAVYEMETARIEPAILFLRATWKPYGTLRKLLISRRFFDILFSVNIPNFLEHAEKYYTGITQGDKCRSITIVKNASAPSPSISKNARNVKRRSRRRAENTASKSCSTSGDIRGFSRTR